MRRRNGAPHSVPLVQSTERRLAEQLASQSELIRAASRRLERKHFQLHFLNGTGFDFDMRLLKGSS